MDVFDRPVIFVGGAPRSGTTVTHAILCTSARANSYCPEVGFLQPVFNAYRIGIKNWSIHTGAFYPDKASFADSMRTAVLSFLADISRAVGEPEVLCLKDPALSPLFYWVHQLLGDQVRFVTVVRHPAAIVRSRQEVTEKLKQSFTEAGARAAAAEINGAYAHLDVASMSEVVLPLRYEDLGRPDVLDSLRDFTGFNDISTEKLWSEQVDFIDPSQRGAWHSPKYYGPVSVEDRLEPLRADLRGIVDDVCAPMMQRFRYAHAGDVSEGAAKGSGAVRLQAAPQT